MGRREDERGVVVPSRMMIVAIVVLAIAGVMYVATQPDRGGATTPAAEQSAATTPTPSATPKQPLGTITPTATPTSTPSGSASAPSSKRPSATASKSAKPKPRAVVKRSDTYVQVFNNSGRTGLAGTTARKAEGVGWKVVGADNWYGTVPASTVYYPDDLRAAARVLARDLGISRLKERVAPMRNDGLTVILTSDYQA